MASYEPIYISKAQKFIRTQLEKKASDKMIGLMWGGTGLNLGPDEYGLVIYKGKKKTVFKFTKDELIKGYGSTECKSRLLKRINEILMRLEI
jgi:hypothetical protein